VERCAFLPRPQEADVDIAAPRRVDAARTQQEVQYRIGGDAWILPWCTHKTRDEYTNGLRGLKRRIDVDVGPIHLAHCRANHVVQISIAYARDRHGADIRQENVALRIDGLNVLEGERAPHAKGHSIANSQR